MAKGGLFKTKEDMSSEIKILKSEVQEIVPDADFRFSLVITKSGDKHFVIGTENDILKELENEV